jgi:hypothetical protein
VLRWTCSTHDALMHVEHSSCRSVRWSESPGSEQIKSIWGVERAASHPDMIRLPVLPDDGSSNRINHHDAVPTVVGNRDEAVREELRQARMVQHPRPGGHLVAPEDCSGAGELVEATRSGIVNDEITVGTGRPAYTPRSRIR